MRTMTRGPYVNEARSEVYYPVSDYSCNEARHQAANHAFETIGAWGRSRYRGRMDLRLHDEEDWEECESCPSEPTWAFEMYEGSYRGPDL